MFSSTGSLAGIKLTIDSEETFKEYYQNDCTIADDQEYIWNGLKTGFYASKIPPRTPAPKPTDSKKPSKTTRNVIVTIACIVALALIGLSLVFFYNRRRRI
ncbi:hypothetical protein TVAG_228040 [Trichomonas vaginalis G3]|uniref:Uncharacterized protein n=1 Tax=Trichomonas vaginalis (strain ATCC PRA-98 / G3) TaxID=412133 RepID=A2FW12_TRIV3|nr:hypothetical protein TVAGG3_0699520 [Trichomonas vaginalis G3]EAX90903.1 hypothetical protein TVAG_228040 [Trichomonas vaginalis G3]KAI5509144.1 hypothetical protein TVAGG3_0699520 [Trichomonas vaginalis G3]|eukprot:XP_001303833.1 hypothetical protein [Trichomonas vaginalis G3]